MSNFAKLILSLIICQLPGIIGGFIVSGNIDSWYEPLNKPGFSPPNWLFGPVWIFLYLLMGISMFLIWKEDLKNKKIKKSFLIFIFQLVLNTLWTIVFFGMHSISGALIIILALWILILICIINFLKISKTAGVILIPYLLWTTFAAVLNYYIFALN
jgi:tryptophan-rich sensory protein